METPDASEKVLSETIICSLINEKLKEIEQQDQLIREIEEKKCHLRNQILQMNHDLNRVPIGINSLPDEVLSYMAEDFLDLQSRRASRQVCRRWFHVIRMESSGLVIYGERQELNSLKGQHWFYSARKPINTNSSIMLKRTQLYRTYFTSFDTPPITEPFLMNLKRLYLTKSIDRKLWNIIDFVNKLKNLEELELGALWDECERPYTFWIHCPKLKSLAIGEVVVNVTIEITSKLVQFKTNDYLNCFRFKHPEELQELHLMSDVCKVRIETEFCNLKVFKCANDIDEESSRRLIENSPELTDLHLGISHNLIKYQLIEKSALDALKLKEAFKRSKLNIMFYGVKLDCMNEFSAYCHFKGNDSKKIIRLLMKNYSKLAYLPTWVEQISYNDLIESLADELPQDFFRKFPNIKELQVHNNVSEPVKLLTFLKNCKTLSSLSFENSSLDELFFGEIDYSSIKRLKINESDCQIQKFNFIWQLSHLDFFQAILVWPNRLASRGLLDYFKVRTGTDNENRRSIKIVKDYKAGFELKIDNHPVHRKIYTAPELVEELAKL